MDQMEGANACDLQQYTVVVEKMKETLGFKAKSRQIYPSKSGSCSELRERVTAYNADFGTGNDGLTHISQVKI